jgi:hypothetical protein
MEHIKIIYMFCMLIRFGRKFFLSTLIWFLVVVKLVRFECVCVSACQVGKAFSLLEGGSSVVHQQRSMWMMRQTELTEVVGGTTVIHSTWKFRLHLCLL